MGVKKICVLLFTSPRCIWSYLFVFGPCFMS
jgi:hypothetical protein